MALAAKEPLVSYREINLYGPTTKLSYRQNLLARFRELPAYDREKEEAFADLSAQLKERQHAQIRHENGQRLKGKRAVVTGATGEIGRAIVRRYLQEGAGVVLAGHNTNDNLNRLREQLMTEGYSAEKIEVLILDLSKPRQITAAAKAILEKGDVDILVNNAGTSGLQEALVDLPFGEYKPENTPEAMDSLFAGSWLLTKALAPQMKEGASVINISSVFSRTDYYPRIEYVVPEAALNGLSEELAWELGRSRGIRVNTIYLGPIDTNHSRDAFAVMAGRMGVDAKVINDEFLKLMAINKGFPKKE